MNFLARIFEILFVLLFPKREGDMPDDRLVLLCSQGVVEFVGGPRDGQILRPVHFAFVARNCAMWWIGESKVASFYALEEKDNKFQMSYVGNNSEMLIGFLKDKYGSVPEELKTASSFLKAISR